MSIGLGINTKILLPSILSYRFHNKAQKKKSVYLNKYIALYQPILEILLHLIYQYFILFNRIFFIFIKWALDESKGSQLNK